MAFEVIEGAKETCYFCGQSFDNVADQTEHILNHFERKTCFGCDNELIRIGDKWYQQHIDDSCIAIKLELNIDDTEMHDVDLVATNDQEMEIEPLEFPISADYIPPEYDPFVESDPFAEILAPESNIEIEQLEHIRLAHPTNADKNRHFHSRTAHPPPSRPKSGDVSCASRGGRSLKRIHQRVNNEDNNQSTLIKNEEEWPLTHEETDTDNEDEIDESQPSNVLKCDKLRGTSTESDSASSTAGVPQNQVSRKVYVKIWTCKLCSAKAKIAANIYQHIRIVHGSNDEALAKPIFDENVFEVILSSNSPGFRHADVKLWTCTMCSTTAKSSSNIYKHIRTVHRVDDRSLVKPIFDAEEAEAIRSSQLPQFRHADVKLWACGRCTMTATIATNMYKHIRAAHGVDDKTLAKPIFDAEEAEAIRRPQLPEFRKVDVKLWACERCTTSATNAQNIYKHIRSAHGVDDKTLAKPIFDTDEAEAIRRSQLPELRKADVKLWACERCTMTATTAQNIYKHIRTAHGVDDKTLAKPIFDTEDVGAIRRSQLPKFRQADVKLWACERCPMTATTASNIYKHIRSAHGVDDKTLATQIRVATEAKATRALKMSHFRSVNVGLWTCKMCTVTTKTSTNMYSHIRTVHGVEDRTLAEPIIVAETADAIPTSRTRELRYAKVKMWLCSLCSVTEKLSANIHKHIRTVHGIDDKTLAKPIHDEEEIEAMLAT